MENSSITFAVVQNLKYGDYRVNKYRNGVWENQRDGNWNKEQAEEIAERFRKNNANGYATMY
jgi:hypothetical protein